MRYSVSMVAELPPAIAFMLSEFPGSKLALSRVRKSLSDASFVRDFFDQCLAGIGTFKYADRLEVRVDKFDVYAGYSLDPLSPDGKCRMLGCKIAYAHQFARTACLYADRVVIPDPFSFTLDVSDEEVFESLVILTILRPLLEAGVIVFGPAAVVSCSGCAKAMREAEKQLTAQLWREFKQSKPDVFRYKDGRRWHMSFGSPLLTSAGDKLRLTVPATREAIAASKPGVMVNGKNAMDLVRHYQKFLRKHFAQCAQGVVFSTQMGGSCKSTVAANTREEAAGYRLLDRRKVGFAQPDWTQLRTVPLPALERLNALQSLQVRKEAECQRFARSCSGTLCR